VARIDFEAHYYTPEYVKILRSRAKPPRQELLGDGRARTWFEPTLPDLAVTHRLSLVESLLDIDAARISAMDAAGIDRQVLSLSAPGTEQFESSTSLLLARDANDALAEAVRRHPDRFIGMATLAPALPEDSADELERCVTKLGFRGANLHSHVGDASYDEPRFRPIFAMAEKLEVPIYLHPTVPHATVGARYVGYGWALPGPGLGFGAETALQTMRLVLSGLFDEHPSLRIVLGHLGEALTFWINRLDIDFKLPWADRGGLRLDRLPSEYIRENFFFTTSTFLTSALVSVLMEMGPERIMFASDHPWLNMHEAVGFLDNAPIDGAEREQISSLNAAKLLALDGGD
jgi:predicted TIM-barrel fold metal-dependent hydrolase